MAARVATTSLSEATPSRGARVTGGKGHGGQGSRVARVTGGKGHGGQGSRGERVTGGKGQGAKGHGGKGSRGQGSRGARVTGGKGHGGQESCVENEFNVPIALSAFRDKGKSQGGQGSREATAIQSATGLKAFKPAANGRYLM